MAKYSRILITGSARSGTRYTARLLQSALGIPVSHEEVFGLHTNSPAGIAITTNRTLDPNGPPPDWGDFRIAVSWLAIPLIHQLPSDIAVIHQVRHPIKTISSIYRRGFLQQSNQWGRYAIHNISRITHQGPFPWDRDPVDWSGIWSDPLVNACRYWVRWSEWILQFYSTDKVFTKWRVEDLTVEKVRGMAELVGVRRKWGPCEVPPTNDNSASREFDPEKVPESLADLPEAWREPVRELGILFGYGDLRDEVPKKPAVMEPAVCDGCGNQVDGCICEQMMDWYGGGEK